MAPPSLCVILHVYFRLFEFEFVSPCLHRTFRRDDYNHVGMLDHVGSPLSHQPRAPRVAVPLIRYYGSFITLMMLSLLGSERGYIGSGGAFANGSAISHTRTFQVTVTMATLGSP